MSWLLTLNGCRASKAGAQVGLLLLAGFLLGFFVFLPSMHQHYRGNLNESVQCPVHILQSGLPLLFYALCLAQSVCRRGAWSRPLVPLPCPALLAGPRLRQ